MSVNTHTRAVQEQARSGTEVALQRIQSSRDMLAVVKSSLQRAGGVETKDHLKGTKAVI